MNILLNQPVRFWPFGQSESKMALAAKDDTEYQFQIQAEDIYGDYSDWAENGDFSSATGWTLSGPPTMSITGGELTGSVETSFVSAQNSYVLQANEVYRITVVVTENTGTLFIDLSSDYYLYSTGTYQVIHKPSSNELFKLRMESGNFTIDSVKIEMISDNYAFKAYLAQENNTFVNDIDLTSRDRTFLTYDVLMSSYSVAYKKYKFLILDPLTNSGSQCLLKNGNFANREDSTAFIWEQDISGLNTFSVSQNAVSYEHELFYNGFFVSTSDIIKQVSALTDGVEYTITFEITELTNTTLIVGAGTNTTTFTTIGAKSTTLTCAGNTDLSFKFTSGGSGTMTIKNVAIVMTDTANYSSDYESNLIDYRESWCDQLEVRCVFSNRVLGLGDPSVFIPTALYPIQVINAEYEDDELNYTDSNGRRSVHYFTQRKNKVVESEMMAEYMHDFLAILKGFDNVYIGSKEYTIMDQYTTTYIADDYGHGKMLVGERTQNRISNNKNISSVGIDVSSSGNFLVDPNGNFIVDTSGNNLITP